MRLVHVLVQVPVEVAGITETDEACHKLRRPHVDAVVLVQQVRKALRQVQGESADVLVKESLKLLSGR